jgi:hypothetical protein
MKTGSFVSPVPVFRMKAIVIYFENSKSVRTQ